MNSSVLSLRKIPALLVLGKRRPCDRALKWLRTTLCSHELLADGPAWSTEMEGAVLNNNNKKKNPVYLLKKYVLEWSLAFPGKHGLSKSDSYGPSRHRSQKLRITELSQGATRDPGGNTRFCKIWCRCNRVLNKCSKMGVRGIHYITSV